ncbi:MAG TPA: FG-GAP-like repeat-containing protein [Gammaproteobacteria bacterium]|nr:FG-GAP-like repeat-containing protein [Gammaproteobacteria bacterium]
MSRHSFRAMIGFLVIVLSASAGAAVPAPYPGLLYGMSGLTGATRMAVADFNHDDLPDVAVAAGEAKASRYGVWLFAGQAEGGYAAPAFYATAIIPTTLAASDLNSDGWTDIVTGNDTYSADQVSVLMNQGDGTFAAPVDYSTPSGYALTVALADVTSDGRPDVVVGASAGSVYVIPGFGDGSLDTSGIQSLDTTVYYNVGVLVADIGGDSYPDLLVASKATSRGTATTDAVAIFSGAADGKFTTTPNQSIAVNKSPAIATADVNEDGVPDVVVVSEEQDTVQVLLNNSGTLTDSGTTYHLPPRPESEWLLTADLDGDGHVDVLTPPSILYGRGDGTFDAPADAPGTAWSVDAEALDINNDGRMDLLAAHEAAGAFGLTVVRNLGDRTFLSYHNYRNQGGDGEEQRARDMATADFNGDSLPDVVTANQHNNTLSVLLNNGSGGFGLPTILDLPSANAVATAATGDINGDGASDIVTADKTGIYSWLGNGEGAFPVTVSSASPSSGEVWGLALGDADGDGAPELVVSLFDDNAIAICSGDGGGKWSCSPAFAVGKPGQVALADFNGDDALDVAVLTTTASTSVSDAWNAYVYLGAGDGTFPATATAVLPVRGRAWGMAAGDVDLDSIVDLVFAGQKVSVFAGKGDGTFGAPGAFPPGPVSHGAAFVSLADTNGDGAPEIVTASNDGDTFAVLLNKPDGSFGAPVAYGTVHGIGPFLTVDMDGDRLADIVSGSALVGQVSVHLHNHAPIVARAEPLTIEENATASGALKASDREHDPLTFAMVTQPKHGSVELDARTGEYTYTPNADYNGKDSFTVTASDGLNASEPVAVPITVEAAPDDNGGSDNGGTDPDGDKPGDDTGLSTPGSSGGGGGLGGLVLGALGFLAMSRRRRGTPEHAAWLRP